jgi:hypothetical protein
MTALQWIETKAIPAVKKWWKPAAVVVGFILVVVVGKILLRGLRSIFSPAPAGPPPADGIVSQGEAEKQKIADQIAQDSSQALADRINKLTEPEVKI